MRESSVGFFCIFWPINRIDETFNEEKGICDNDFDILLGIARKLKQRIVEGGIGKNDDEDVIDFDHIAEVTEFEKWFFGHWHMNRDMGKYQCLYYKVVELEQ